jgi:hypothetical protein
VNADLDAQSTETIAVARGGPYFLCSTAIPSSVPGDPNVFYGSGFPVRRESNRSFADRLGGYRAPRPGLEGEPYMATTVE